MTLFSRQPARPLSASCLSRLAIFHAKGFVSRCARDCAVPAVVTAPRCPKFTRRLSPRMARSDLHPWFPNTTCITSLFGSTLLLVLPCTCFLASGRQHHGVPNVLTHSATILVPSVLQAVSNSSSAWHNTENTFVGHSDKQERIVSSVTLQAELWHGHCQQRSNRFDKVNFVAASRPDSPVRPRLRQVDWRNGTASDKELMDRATGKMVGTVGSAISSMLGVRITVFCSAIVIVVIVHCHTAGAL